MGLAPARDKKGLTTVTAVWNIAKRGSWKTPKPSLYNRYRLCGSGPDHALGPPGSHLPLGPVSYPLHLSALSTSVGFAFIVFWQALSRSSDCIVKVVSSGPFPGHPHCPLQSL